MTIDMSQFFQVFFDEAEELLAEMERQLLSVDVASPDIEVLNAVFRSAHSIKGGAATFGITDLAEVTHILESLLDKIRKGEMALTAEHIDAFLSAKDILKMQLDGHRLKTPVDQDAVADVRMMLQSLSQGSVSAASPPVGDAQASVETEPSAVAGMKHHFRIALPEVPQRDVDALASELGLLGSLTQKSLDEKRFILMLSTNDSVDDIIAICSFVLDPADLEITEEMPSAEEDQLYASSAQDPGYGFFEPLDPPAPPAQNSSPSEEELGYGFFEPEVMNSDQVKKELSQEVGNQ